MVKKMNDYISKEQLINEWDDLGRRYAMPTTPIHKRAIREFPSADVRENIHGEWFAITQPWADTQIFQCTCCGRYIEVPQYEVSTLTIRYPFCHCGADMRGE